VAVNDPLERLEAELASLRPASLSRAVVDAIGDELASESQPLRFADRCLLAVMSAGSLAACVIVGLVIWRYAAIASPPPLASSPPPVLDPRAPTHSLGGYREALADSGSVAAKMLR
jgi:hypothetical protein